MRLQQSQAKPSWKRRARAASDARVKPLLQDLKEPAAIAFSGGGDSTALLHMCAGHPHITHAFIIDHALRDGSAAEVQQAAEDARALGYEVQTERWSHGGVSSAIQAKARDYRYAAMGRMCRAAGIKHLITGHTSDDQAETLLMRLDRKTGWRGLAGMRESAFAPLWPALMGITLHRPMLSMSRAELRAYAAAEKLRYVDDPSNENRDFARVRARQFLLADQGLRRDLLAQQTGTLSRLMDERREQADWLSRFAKISPHGFVETSSAPPAELLLHILNAVSGRGGPIDAMKRKRLSQAMTESDFSTATLAGAWAVRTSHGFLFTRDRVAVKGRRLSEQADRLHGVKVAAGANCLWDGRFFVQAQTHELILSPAHGQLGKLADVTETKAIFDCPAEVRACLPIYNAAQMIVGFGGVSSQKVTADAVSARRLQQLL